MNIHLINLLTIYSANLLLSLNLL